MLDFLVGREHLLEKTLDLGQQGRSALSRPVLGMCVLKLQSQKFGQLKPALAVVKLVQEVEALSKLAGHELLEVLDKEELLLNELCE